MNEMGQEVPARLLVVDDNEMNRDLLSRRLTKQGHAVAMAEDGKRALEMLAASEFDLVLLDIMMPGMDGYEVLERIKSDQKLRHIPVVMISAVGETESVVRCIELGADDYLPKPFNPVVLRARVNSSLDKKKLRDRERLYAASMERELEIGRKIQAGFFPAEIPQPAGWEIAAFFEPARQVAGDFYDAFVLPGGGIGVLVADVCDKGVGAALYMALFRSLLRSAAMSAAADEPAAVTLERSVRLTNDYIGDTHGSANMFATLFFCVIDPATGEMPYINGGHEAPMLIRADGSVERLRPTGPAVGMLPFLTFGIARAAFASADRLLLFTDGVTEARGPSGFFGEERLVAFASGHKGSAAALLGDLRTSLAEHVAGMEPSDDTTVMAVARG